MFRPVRFLPILVVALALAAPAFADAFSKNLSLREPARLGGTQRLRCVECPE